MSARPEPRPTRRARTWGSRWFRYRCRNGRIPKWSGCRSSTQCWPIVTASCNRDRQRSSVVKDTVEMIRARPRLFCRSWGQSDRARASATPWACRRRWQTGWRSRWSWSRGRPCPAPGWGWPCCRGRGCRRIRQRSRCWWPRRIADPWQYYF